MTYSGLPLTCKSFGPFILKLPLSLLSKTFPSTPCDIRWVTNLYVIFFSHQMVRTECTAEHMWDPGVLSSTPLFWFSPELWQLVWFPPQLKTQGCWRYFCTWQHGTCVNKKYCQPLQCLLSSTTLTPLPTFKIPCVSQKPHLWLFNKTVTSAQVAGLLNKAHILFQSKLISLI